MKNIYLVFLLLFTFTSRGGHYTDSSQVYLYDQAHVLNEAEYTALEKQLQEYKDKGNAEILVILTKGQIKQNANQFAENIANTRKPDEKIVILTADISQHVYGFFVSKNLKSQFPDWAIAKIENQFLKRNFREKNYSKGLYEATASVFAIAKGEMDAKELKKDSSNGLTLLLMVVLVFFLILFPIIQFRKMKKGHLASKPLDFVQGVLLANRYGTRGKNLFDDFANTKGAFASDNHYYNKAKGIEGSW